MTKNYDPLDDAMALIGHAIADEDATDEELLLSVRARNEDELEALVLTLTGIAAGLSQTIADEAGEPHNAVVAQMHLHRPEEQDAASDPDGSV